MASQKDMDELAESIRAGIAKHGVHVLDEDELTPIRDYHGPGSEMEKRLQIDNFGRTYGFDVHYSTFLQVAIFRKLNQGDASGAIDAGS